MVSEKKEEKKEIKKPEKEEKPYKHQKGDNTKLIYDKVLRSGRLTNFISGKDVRRIATVILYEQIGENNIIFEGTYPLLRGTKTKIFGEYCLIDYKGKMKYIDVPPSEDFIYSKDKKVGKVIQMLKYSEDDFRVYKIINGTYYKKYKKPIMEEVTYKDEETSEEYTVEEQKKDKNGELMYEVIEQKYINPRGITQEARDVIKSGNEYEIKMDEFKKSNQGFMDKYGQIVIPVAALAVALLIMIFSIKSATDMMSDTADKLSGIKQELEKNPWYANDQIIKSITDKVEQKQANDKAPPTK